MASPLIYPEAELYYQWDTRVHGKMCKTVADLVFPNTVFAGHDASRALGLSSTKAEDVSPDWSTLSDKEKGVLEDWLTFFSKRYNIVGKVEGATNL